MRLYLLLDAENNVTSCLSDPYPGAMEIEVADDYNIGKAIYSKIIDGEIVYDAEREAAIKQAELEYLAKPTPKSQLQILQETVDQLVLDSLGV